MKKCFLLFLFLGIITFGFSQTNKPQDRKNGVDKNQAETVTEDIFVEPEEMPQFIGGDEAMFKFLHDNIKYPQSAIDSLIEGTVYVSFIVETDGSSSEIKIIRGIHPDCDAEALRLVSLFPKWIPGKLNGKTISMNMIMPIKFQLSKK